MQNGKELERLVASLERALAGSNGKVEAPSRKLLDRDTGKRREHDVVITWDRGHHQIVTAVECRDRKRPVGVPDVEAFADKCAATGVHHGVMVSATGFRETARKKAATRGISCMEMTEAQEFDWLGIDYVTGYHREFRDWNIVVMFDGDNPPANLETIIDDAGEEVHNAALARRIVGGIPADIEPGGEVDGDRPVRLHVQTPGWTARVDGGQVRPIDHILADAVVRTTLKVTPIQRHTYSGEGHKYSFASAPVSPIPGVEGNLVMVQDHADQEGGTRIFWVPERPAVNP